jgi:hypothetical protein
VNSYEEYLLKLQRRLKKIEENSEIGRLKINKIRYEIQFEETKERIEAWRQKKPFSNGGDMTAGLLAEAMGFTSTGGLMPAFQTMQPHKYLEHAKSRGLPVEHSCDMTMMPFAMMESGDVPMEDLSVCDEHACTPMMLRGIYVAHQSGNQTFFIDIPLEQNERALNYVTDQLGEFIEFAEKRFPGIKYDEDKLIELQSYSEQIHGYSYEIFQMLKNKPCPIGGMDAFTGAGGVSKKWAEYMRARRDEVAERVAKGEGAVPGEKLRMLWTVTRPFFMDPFAVLAKWKIVVPFHYSGPVASWAPIPGRAFWGNRALSPLEKVAANALSDQWGHFGSKWVEDMVWVCQELQINAIINYCMLGCTATLGLKRLVEETTFQKLGIPTLQLEGKQWDKSYADEKTISDRLQEFAQICLSQHGLL